MPRPHNRLTARAAISVKAPGRHADGGGLYLLVGPDGAKRWVFIFQRQGRRREMGLGALADVPLADAREASDECATSLAASASSRAQSAPFVPAPAQRANSSRPVKSYFYLSSAEALRRRREACAALGYDPAGLGLGDCMADLNAALLRAGHPST